MPYVHELAHIGSSSTTALAFQLPASAVLSPYKLSSTRTFPFRLRIKQPRRNPACVELRLASGSYYIIVRIKGRNRLNSVLPLPRKLKVGSISRLPILHTPASDLYHSFMEIIVIVHIRSQPEVTKVVHQPTAGGALVTVCCISPFTTTDLNAHHCQLIPTCYHEEISKNGRSSRMPKTSGRWTNSTLSIRKRRLHNLRVDNRSTDADAEGLQCSTSSESK